MCLSIRCNALRRASLGRQYRILPNARIKHPSMIDNNKFDEALNNLDLLGVMMVQGVLVNRALKLIYEQKEAETTKSKVLTPNKGLIL